MSEAGAVLIVIGALFCAAAALGLLRFPDVYTRLHAASKAGPVGAGLILLGTGLASADLLIAVRCVMGFAFVLGTAPVSGHLLGRAALKSGVAPDQRTNITDVDVSR